MGKQQGRLYILDSLRGLAAILVCLHHLHVLNFNSFAAYPTALLRIIEFLSGLNHFAVLFFFVLSGFSIGLSLKKSELIKAEEINTYLYRRFKRILPVYFISIAFTATCGALIKKVGLWDYGLENLIGNLLFLQSSKYANHYWFSPYGLNGPLWSLSYELFFYMLFPLVYIINRKYLNKLTLLVKLACLVALTLFCIYLNKLYFIPYLAFSNLFIIWLLGFIISRAYLFNRSFDTMFITVLLINCVYPLFNAKYASDSLNTISQGLWIAGLFYAVWRLSRNIFLIGALSIVERSLNFLFLQSGKGSYVLYILHYPLLMSLVHFDVPVLYQTLGLMLLIFVSKRIEEWCIGQQWLVLKLNYIPTRAKAQ